MKQSKNVTVLPPRKHAGTTKTDEESQSSVWLPTAEFLPTATSRSPAMKLRLSIIRFTSKVTRLGHWQEFLRMTEFQAPTQKSVINLTE